MYVSLYKSIHITVAEYINVYKSKHYSGYIYTCIITNFTCDHLFLALIINKCTAAITQL